MNETKESIVLQRRRSPNDPWYDQEVRPAVDIAKECVRAGMDMAVYIDLAAHQGESWEYRVVLRHTDDEVVFHP
jgi:hypothetical protein